MPSSPRSPSPGSSPPSVTVPATHPPALPTCSTSRPAPSPAEPGAAELVRIAGEGFADMVDQAVATAFGHRRASNHLRIKPLQDIAFMSGNCTPKTTSSKSSVEAAERVLSQRHVESLLFRGRGKIS
ncbi:unnamed protein product, partial [Musa hybrid cultivar]